MIVRIKILMKNNGLICIYSWNNEIHFELHIVRCKKLQAKIGRKSLNEKKICYNDKNIQKPKQQQQQISKS